MASTQVVGRSQRGVNNTASVQRTRAAVDALVAARQPSSRLAEAPPDLLVLSVEQFPAIRTQFGDHIWEQAVGVVSRLVTASLRPGDVAVRYGEHQFVVLLADGSAKAIDVITATVRAALVKANEDATLPMALSLSAASAAAFGSLEESVARAHASTHALDRPAGPQTESSRTPSRPAGTRVIPASSPTTTQDMILIVEDEPGLLTLAKETLVGTGAGILCARRGQEALEHLAAGQIDVVVADIHLPDLSGLDLLKKIRQVDPGVVVIMITGSHDLALAIHAIRGGADDYLIKPFNPHDLRDSVSRGLTKRQLILGGKAYQAMLESQVQQRTREFAQVIRHLEATYRATLKALGAALDTRDVETHAHSERVAQYALTLGRLVDMNEADLITLERGVYLHDIGKIGIPDRVLLKQGRLTEEEWEIMRRHSQLGFRLASRIDFLNGASKIILTHHERFDGSGYPYGLKGEAIPFGARIFAVVDTLDAMTSDRPYRKALPFGQARDEISRFSGRQFDPRVVDAFLSVPEHTWSDIRESVNQQAQAQIDVSDESLLDEGRNALL